MKQKLIESVKMALKRAKDNGLTIKQLSDMCGVGRENRRELSECLRILTAKEIVVESKLRLYHTDYMASLKGEVVRLRKKFGFVKLQDGTEMFVPGRFFLGALPGDTVLVNPIKSRTGEPEGEIIKVLKEGEATFTGTIRQEDGKFFIEPDSLMSYDMPIDKADLAGAGIGEKVLFRIKKRGRRHSEHEAAVITSFGSSQNAYNCAKAMLALNDVTPEFSDTVIAEAKAIDQINLPQTDLSSRTDMRDEIIFTIDGADTKDIDDAISIRRRGDMFELGVHIADVSHYVKPQSALDEEAFKRGTSIYFADSVVPMLPPELSNGICSLNPNVDRLAFSCIMAIDSTGKLIDFDFKKTIIHSRVQGVYSEINSILSHSETDEIKTKYQGLYETIFLMEELADILTQNKHERGAPEIETVETKIILDHNNVAVGVEPRLRGKSEVVIEEFMLMANQSAATAAKLKEIPFVHRVHEPPSEQKLATLVAAMNTLGVDSKPITVGLPAKTLSKLIADSRDKKYYPVVNVLVLRSMSKAKYFEEPIGHYGLALDNYAQFTSPIRRYPDLSIHRILSDVVKGMPLPKVRAKYEKFVVASARHSTERELVSMRLERNCNDCYKAEYMKSHIGEVFDAIISSVAFHGLYVSLPNSIEGLIKVENLPEGQYEFDELFTMKETLGGTSYSIGDAIKVKCISVDVSSGNVDFATA